MRETVFVDYGRTHLGTTSRITPAALSISSSVVNRDSDTRTVLFASSAVNPIARSTALGSTRPEEHADPVDTATPFKSIAMTSPSASTP